MTRAGLAGHRLEHSRSGGGNDLPLADFAELLSHLLAERLKHPFVAINPQEYESPLDKLLEGLAVGITPGLVRISAGLEAVTDIIADVAQALDRAG